MRFLRDWVATWLFFVALALTGCDGGGGGAECNEVNPCGSDSVCRQGVCMDAAEVRLTVTAVAEGATAEVAIFIYDLASGDSCQAGACAGFDYGTPIKLRASPIGGHRFVGWVGGDKACTGSELELVIDKLTDDLYCVAKYVRRTRVTGVVAGGPEGNSSGVIASSDHPTASCQESICEVDLGAKVKLSAPVRWGERFGYWSGAGCGDAASPETSVTALDGDLVCSANYVGRYTVAGRAAGAKAMISVSSSARGAVCERTSCLIDEGGDAVLEAPPVEGFRFAGWSGTSACTGSIPRLIIDPVVAPQQCLATYTPRVRVRGSSQGAMPPPRVVALSTDAFADCIDQSCTVDVGGSATLLASSAAGYRLSGWTGEMCGEDEKSAALNLERVLENIACVAEYREGIAVIGAVVGARGEVKASSSTDGAQCVADRCVIDAGGDATLEAPVLEGSQFLGWEGDEGCESSEPIVRFMGVRSSRTCFARYTPRFSVSGVAAPPESGTIVASSPTPGASCEGATCLLERGEVVLEVRPNRGYRFAGWSGGGACAGNEPSVRISDITGNLRCQANFVSTITVTGVGRPEGTGSVRVSADLGAASCSGAVCAVDRGSVVGVSAIPSDGYEFAGWSDCSSAREPVITLSAVEADTVCTANFAPRRFTVTSNLMPAEGGSVASSSTASGASCSGGSCSVSLGGDVRLVATAAPGFRFADWSGCISSNAPDITIGSVRSNLSCTARFTREALTVTVTATAGAGGDVQALASADGAMCTGTICTTPHGGGSITLRATPQPGFTFSGWSGCSSSIDPTLILRSPTQSTSCLASFAPQRLTAAGVLNAASPAGSGTVTASSPAPGASCAGASCTLDFGATVEFVATPSASFRFAGWTGCVTSGAATISIANVQTNVTCTASFERDRFSVRGVAEPATGGSVTASSTAPGATCVGDTCMLNQGDNVTLTAVPSAGSGFVGWSGAGCPPAGGPVHSFTVSAQVTCTARFAVLPPQMVALVAGAGGRIDVMSPAGCAPPGCAVASGGSLVATAVPDSGFTFDGWTGMGCTSNGATLTLNNVTLPLSCTATFVPSYTIVGRVADGQDALGSVTVSAGTSACPDNRCVVRAGASIVVVVSPAPGATFAGWAEPACQPWGASAMFPATASLTCTATFTGSAPGPAPVPDAGAGRALGVFPPLPGPLVLPLLGVPPQDAGLPAPDLAD